MRGAVLAARTACPVLQALHPALCLPKPCHRPLQPQAVLRALPPTPAAAGSSRDPQEWDATGAGMRQPQGRARRAMCLQQRSAKPPQGSRQQGTRGALRRDLKSKYVWGKNAKGLSRGCHGRYLLDAGTTKQICSAEPQHPARQTLPLKLCGKSVKIRVLCSHLS